MRSSRQDSVWSSMSARVVTISVGYRPPSSSLWRAPNSRQSTRKAMLVTPAMGASMTGVSTVSGPMVKGLRSRPDGATGAVGVEAGA